MKNEARDRFLTELIGECWHDSYGGKIYLPKNYSYDTCSKCSAPTSNRPDFSTWEGFGKLKEFIDIHEKADIIYNNYLDKITEYTDRVSENFRRITPDSFADHVYDEFQFYGK